MRGVLKDCFDIPGWGGVTVALLPDDEELIQAGDWLIVEGQRWQISGIPHVKRMVDDPETRRLISAVLRDATKVDVSPLLGRNFLTESVSGLTRL
jgi:hypothetical protein